MKSRGGVFLFFFATGLTVGVWGGEALRTHKQTPVPNGTPAVETAEPPLALEPEPKEPEARVRWIERIVERRMVKALDVDPDAKTGPVVDVLAVKLAGFIRKLLKIALELAVVTAIGLYVWSHWYLILAWVLGQTGISWLIGRKKA